MGRTALKFILDLGVWTLVVPVAYALRLEGVAAHHVPDVAAYAAAGLLVKAAVLWAARLESRSWHRVGIRDLVPLGALVAGVSAVGLVAAAVRPAGLFLPRSVPAIEGLLAVLGLAGLRLSARLYYEEKGVRWGRRRTGARRVLVVGAGETGLLVVREMLRNPGGGRLPVGFVDDDPAKRRQSFAGLPVLGTVDQIGAAADRADADEVLIAVPSGGPAFTRRVVERAREAGLEHRTVPSLHDLVSGRVSVSAIREVDVEDLLGRDPVRLDSDPIRRYVRGRTVLVTGAGGSIGSEIVRQVAAFEPDAVVLLGRGENSVFEVDRELARTHPGLRRHAVICDVRDERSLRAVFERHRPDVVFHAAAHKHVPLMEANPEQAVWNNVGGTQNAVRLALEFGACRFVNVSTDKAVNPTSVMGASKRTAEMVVADAARQCPPGCAVVSVRFGNVLGSRGSVVPLFREQIERGEPISVTDPEMVRYFMTIPEASSLVLQAGAVAENGRVYVLDMGEPVKIVDLARDLILLSGLQPGTDVEIHYTGIRPGEKLYEELLTAEEGTEPSPHEKIHVARNGRPPADLHAGLADLFEAAEAGDGDAIRAAFRRLVPTYVPTGDLPAEAVSDAPGGDALPGLSGDGAVHAVGPLRPGR